MWLVHAGNRVDAHDRARARFPRQQVAVVEQRMRALLSELQPAGVVSAAAAGADLLLLDQCSRLGLSYRVVLPLPVSDFRARSVADQGQAWVERFDRLVCAPLVTVIDLSQDPAWYLAGNDVILDHAAREMACGDQAEPHPGTTPGSPAPAGATEELVALVTAPAWDTDSATADFATKAAARGLTVLRIDPSPAGDPA